MQQKSKAQAELEKLMEASGMSQEDIVPLYEECMENLIGIESDLMDVAEDKATVSTDFINRVFRAFHSVKGAAAYLLHDPMKNLSHAAENAMSQVRDGKIALNASLAELLLPVLSRLKDMAGDVNRQLEIDCHVELDSLNAILHPVKPAAVVLDLATEPAQPSGAASALSKKPAGSVRGLRALVVEDELTSRLILQDLLSKHGVCHVAVNGAEAVEAFRSALLAGRGYDVICMDIRMPVMDGTEAVRTIRSLEEKQGIYSSEGVKIFMTTSIRDIRTVTTAFKALCDGYLFKPIDGAELEENLTSFRLISAA